ncbi:uncharacterized protein LOC112347365 isoform X2 [Selaginella moellendorffii]|uniref:uncharacterized protein LOC112347365 isoform X2 n=1 Tax=Selaginella moellendorffii TaxID=88036 RepID=UPI000D1CA922|nr:uncharacterized protein LOC112347365 isoform X2 [Selaginella moellendorffii]|eukprot:XP_024533868.1 uncharacterized protein LOC112347365 isoform X2 [Selaginella moellendorffii]
MALTLVAILSFVLAAAVAGSRACNIQQVTLMLQPCSQSPHDWPTQACCDNLQGIAESCTCEVLLNATKSFVPVDLPAKCEMEQLQVQCKQAPAASAAVTLVQTHREHHRHQQLSYCYDTDDDVPPPPAPPRLIDPRERQYATAVQLPPGTTIAAASSGSLCLTNHVPLLAAALAILAIKWSS